MARVEQFEKNKYYRPEDVIEVGGITINKAAHEVTIDGEPVKLSFKEFELFDLFCDKSGRWPCLVSVSKIMSSIDYFGDARTIDTHVKKLRNKLKK